MSKRRYPNNWREWSYFMRSEVRFRCERCGDPERPDSGHTLTVNPINRELEYIKRANLVVLCRHCQGRLRLIPLDRLVKQLELFDSFELRWLQPHLEGLGIRVPEPVMRRD
jgi:hypothetical protein